MKFTMLAALVAATFTAESALALGAKECALQAGLVMQVVDARSAGAESEAALQQIQAGLNGETQKFATIVSVVVDWVYTLPDEQLGAAVGDAWTEGCLKG
ncbi:hypothetical protein [Puniceibacterium confluentis]|uniref:hypothetical protein n=1 Tax=Puniceibacterium confluentis TaxID=1958944 RepID=UPI0011B76F30|nr:hypothetical protein [Puniceibacterium confluentis]